MRPLGRGDGAHARAPVVVAVQDLVQDDETDADHGPVQDDQHRHPVHAPSAWKTMASGRVRWAAAALAQAANPRSFNRTGGRE